jgi:NAD-dependent deacetylase
MEYATIEAFERDPARVWMMLRELSATLHRARPNAGHEALARLEACGMLAGIITQNIDGLHQEAGSREVLELHGSWRTMACMKCRRRVESRGVPLERLPPLCACGGVLKPDVTLFGEIIPSLLIDAAWQQARSCDCLLVVGTSTEVAPASAIPMAASDCGAFIIEINIEPTPLSNRAVDLRIQAPAGVILPRLAAAVGASREN